ncbi:MAG: hypothetical protein HeimC3_18870 [Candidatus Heimdallarchaeota archaeon LC_3]|nr:MAG: hypothetical protein HeimC3_18870 [Candidatus Heimdallarchaeota archaeon LC_3]
MEIILQPPLLHFVTKDSKNLSQFPTLPTFLILLIRSGSAALGISKNGKITDHKRITRYMVKKKQGKSQITYFSLKGKTSGGEKIRLQQTRKFFDEINKKLIHWSNKIKGVDLILYQTSPRMWGYLFKPNNKIPFDKKDENIFKIPYPVNKPTHKEIEKINKILTKGIISTNIDLDFPEIVELLEKLS